MIPHCFFSVVLKTVVNLAMMLLQIYILRHILPPNYLMGSESFILYLIKGKTPEKVELC